MKVRELTRRILRRVVPPPETPSRKYDRIFRALKKGDVAVDCGANVGRFTEIMARNGATVYAFEPNPHAFRILDQRFSERANVQCVNKAVFTSDTVLPLYLHVNEARDQVYWSTGSSLLECKPNVSKDRFVEVEAVDFCRFIESVGGPVALVKMDIEGAEVAVVKRLIETGTVRQIRHLIVETHEERIPELKQGTDEIRALIRKTSQRNVDLGWI